MPVHSASDPPRARPRLECGGGAETRSLWALDDLRPTQMTIGFHEVACKRQRWRAEGARDDPEFRGRPVPAVLGPGGRAFVLDRHHTLGALKAEGIERVAVSLLGRLDHLDPEAFWQAMDARGWCHPIDAAGVRKPCSAIPQQFEDLADDPFRSLAAALRRSGAYAKTAGPFSEFRWAAHLRQRLTAAQVRQDFSAALRVAQRLARAPAARNLPGAVGWEAARPA